MNPRELPSIHGGDDSAVQVSSAASRAGQELDDLREKLHSAQRIFDDYRAARFVRQRDAEVAWARLVHDAALALPASDEIGRVPPEAAVLPRVASPAPSIDAFGTHHSIQTAIGESRTRVFPAPPARGEEEATERSRKPTARRARWAFLPVVMLAVVASLSAAGVARLKLNSHTQRERIVALSGTAFEATIAPANQFTIAAPLTAVVERVLVSVGQRVEAGQPLLVADSREARAAVEAAGIELRAAEARIAEVRQRLATLRHVPAADFARATGRVATAQRESEQVPTRQWRDSPERAEASYELARLRFERMKKLADQGIVARQEFEDAEISLKVAANDLENARKSAQAVSVLTVAQTEQSDLQWKVARAEQIQQREAHRAELAVAELRREDAAAKLKMMAERLAGATITASGPGVVTELLAHPGDQVYGGAPLIRVAVLDSLLAEVQVAPTLINDLRVGSNASITLPGTLAAQVPGTISAVNPIPNRNGTHTVQVRFDNRDGYLLAGQPAEVRFVLP
jgi:multidrug resistance efflux pump